MAGSLRVSVERKAEQRLEVTIENKSPVALADLTASLHAIGQQYQAFMLNDAPADAQAVTTELLVKDVRSGSFVFDLITKAALPIAPLLWSGGSFGEWCNVAKEMLASWLDTKNKPTRAVSKTDLRQWDSILNPIAKDQGSQMNIVAHDGAIIIGKLVINYNDANVAQNVIRRQLEQMEEPVDTTYRKKVMTWYQARFDSDSQTGNKVKIDSVSRKPLRVVFDNEKIREEMYAQGSDFNIP